MQKGKTPEGKTGLKGIVQRGKTEKGITQRGITQAGITQAGITQTGITQRGITQRGKTERGITQTGKTRKQMNIASPESARFKSAVMKLPNFFAKWLQEVRIRKRKPLFPPC